ncbi:MAG TPA: endonuclease MutS2 [Gemmatimonadaceae bacterium]|nr:endonuclease MutS2 [Gemmatimonadaceae bacterium]
MNEHALRVLEVDRVLERVAERATSEAGAERTRRLAPRTDVSWIASELQRVATVMMLRESHEWSPPVIPALEEPLRRLRAAGSTWSGLELLGGVTLLRSSRETREAFGRAREEGADITPLDALHDQLITAQGPEAAIERAIDSDGTVRDDASPALRRIRRELRGAQSELVQRLERTLGSLESHQRVQDMSVTVRNGRYVIAVRREARAAVGGIVHDESASGQTLFIEPPAAVAYGNHIRELEAEERREVQRILAELTDALRPLHLRMVAAMDALVELDTLSARARFAVDFQCGAVSLGSPDEGFVIINGRHPLLLAAGAPVVPFDLTMQPGEHTLLLSGPNTGGKTVLLKAIGLIAVLTQAGVPVPVAAGSRVAVHDDVFADIGDEQSIQASLSTFSAHLKNLGEILAGATTRSLVLVDELGSGTDPVEGAALGGAILEELTRRGTLTVATTHLGALKLLATHDRSIINASLQFDEVALAPTYRLIKGIPGRSYGLGIARRLRLPDDVLDRAEARLPEGERDLAALLADLETREATLAERERGYAALAEQIEIGREEMAARERELRTAERSAERRARQEARDLLMRARGEVDAVIRELRAAGVDQLEGAARDARRRVEQRAADEGTAAEALAEPDEVVRRTGAGSEPLEIGDVVSVATLDGREGRIVAIRDDEATVAVGSLKLTVTRSALTRRRTREEQLARVVPLLALPEETLPTDLDLRGLRADEIEPIVVHAVDAAVRADMRSLRIIHGKGTGALRERVAEMLRSDSRVRHFRLGVHTEGGTGVTIAEFG